MPIEPTRDEFQINTTTENDQRYQSITTLADGTLLVTWLTPVGDGTGFWLYGQRVTPSGAPIASEFSVLAPSPFISIDPAIGIVATNYTITALNNGGYAVAWHRTGAHVAVETFDPSGSLMSATLLGDYDSHTDTFPSIASLSDGGFVVAWVTNGDDTLGYSDVHAQRFNSSGSLLVGSEIVVNAATVGDHNSDFNPRAVGLSGGGFVVTWMHGDGVQDLFGQVYSASGAPVGSEFQVRSASEGNGSYQAIAALSAGGFVVAWSASQSGSNGVLARMFDASGNPLGNDILVSGPPLMGTYPSITELAGGRFVVTWMAYAGSLGEATGENIYARSFNADGTPNGDVVLMNHTVAGEQITDAYGHSVTPLADGGFAVAWMSDAQDGSLGGIYARTFVVATESSAGPTEGDDILYGDELANSIDGLGGDDQIFGLGGDDTLYGSGDDDILYGGLGADTLDGGSGSDTASYADASAGVQAHLEAPYVNQGEAAGDQYVSIEYLVGSAFGDRLVGNFATANSLWGGDGGDELQALGAGDSLYGEGGNDFLLSTLNSSATLMDGGAGNDIAGINRSLDTMPYIFTLTADVTLPDGSRLVDIERVNFVSGSGDDIITGGSLDDVILGSGGNDQLTGGDGNDDLRGEGGDDILDGGRGNDVLNGGDNDDSLVLKFGEGADTLVGGAGADTLYFNARAGSSALLFDFNSGAFGGSIWSGIERLVYYGSDGADDVTGGAGDDGFQTYLGDDIVHGGAGNDGIHGNDGNDTLFGDQGDDGLFGESGNDSLYGGDNADYLDGGADNDTLLGGAGDDLLRWGIGSGTDTINGESGDDLFVLDSVNATGPVVLNFTSGAYLGTTWQNVERYYFNGSVFGDNVTGGSGADSLFGFGGNDVLWGGPGADIVDGGDGDDLLILYRGYGGDAFQGGSGADTLWLINQSASGLTFDLGSGSFEGSTWQNVERLSFSGGTANEMVTGGLADDSLQGGSGADTLDGAGGNDSIEGGAGGDTLRGGAGDDEFYVLPGDGGDTIDGGEGSDRLTVNNYGLTTGITFDAASGAFDGSTFTSIERTFVQGSNVAGDTLSGQSGQDLLYGFGGNDVIHGLGGADELRGGDGDDLVDGGDGNDIIRGDAGNDTLIGGAGNDSLYGGTGNDNLQDGDGDDFVLGEDGNDVLFVGAGNDQVYGGAGDDFLVASGTGSDLLDGGDGTDRAYLTFAAAGAGVTYTFNGNASVATAVGTKTLANIETVQVEGSAFDDTLTGGAGQDHLSGDAGNDTLIGGAGNDSLYGGTGNDNLQDGDGDDFVLGEDGNDVLFVGAGNDQVYGGAGDDFLVASGTGSDLLDGGDGTDRAYLTFAAAGAGVTYTFNGNASVATAVGTKTLANIETVQVEGSAFDDTLTGGAGQDHLSGDAGNDTLIGGAGNDSLYGGTGNDNLQDGDGDDFVLGEDGNDVLFVGAGNDQVYGGAGDDFLVASGTGSDLLDGGDGTDRAYLTFAAAGAGVTYTFNGNASVATAVGTKTLANIETVQVEGSAFDDTLTGGAGQDHLSGDAGNDRLSGLGANDSLFGGDGNDLLFGGSGDDLLAGGTGGDALDGGVGVDIAAYDASLTGVSVNLANGRGSGGDAAGDTLVGIENLLGSAYADVLVGSNTANMLSGGAGNDTINGGGAADVLIGGSGADKFVFKVVADIGNGPVRDVIMDFEAGGSTLGSSIDLIDLSGIDAMAKTTKDDAFTFIGANSFSGKAGELRVVTTSPTSAMVYGDVDGDGFADFGLELQYTGTLNSSDFIL